MWTCLLQDADDDFITMNNDRCRFNDLAIAVDLQTCFYIFQYILPFLEMSCFFLKQILGNTPIPMVFLDSDPPLTLGHFGKNNSTVTQIVPLTNHQLGTMIITITYWLT